MIRFPAVASQFYPGDEASLRRTLQEIVPEQPAKRQKALAVVSPPTRPGLMLMIRHDPSLIACCADHRFLTLSSRHTGVPT